MAEKRTKLGTITFGVLSGASASCLLNTLVSMIETVADAFKPMDAQTDAIATGSVLLVVMIFCLFGLFMLIAFVIFLYLNAFKKNMPHKIKPITIFLLVIAILMFLGSIMMFSTMTKYQLEPGENSIISTDPVKLMISTALWIAIFVTLLIELRHTDTGKMTHAWIVVGIASIASFINIVVGSLRAEGNLAPRKVIAWIMFLCIFIGLTLISCWITNQEKFYEPFYENAGTSSRENMPPAGDDYTSKLKELKHLLDEGLITEDDYNRKKNNILGLS